MSKIVQNNKISSTSSSMNSKADLNKTSLEQNNNALNNVFSSLQNYNSQISQKISDLEEKQSTSEKVTQDLKSKFDALGVVNKQELSDFVNSAIDSNNKKQVENGIQADSFSKSATDKLNEMIKAQVSYTEAQREVEIDALINDKETLSKILKKYIYPVDQVNKEIVQAYENALSEVFANSISPKLKEENQLLTEQKQQIRQMLRDMNQVKAELSKQFDEFYTKYNIDTKDLHRNLEQKEQLIKGYQQQEQKYKEIERKYNELCVSVGDSTPEHAKSIVDTLRSRIKDLETKIEQLPNREQIENYKKLENDFNILNQELMDNYEFFTKAREIEKQKESLELEKEELERKDAIKEAQITDLEQTIEHYKRALGSFKTAKGQQIDYKQRISQIEKTIIKRKDSYLFDSKKLEKDYTEEELEIFNEENWLKNLMDSIEAQGFYFPPRIIKSFHTSLKIARFSPLTVLAGVSGTGKSELPRLYSKFGGINFLSLAVQPNWDSQESMLGFYNPIENCFEAQPVLRLLAQTQKENNISNNIGYEPTDDEKDFLRNTLKDQLTIILLDEMNLSHVELYFAEFLSKFELRRDYKQVHSSDTHLCLNVNLGSGHSFGIPLDYNVLWTGTMNQDETTKSLSDKVLDRGIIINFPRPKSLKSRKMNADVNGNASNTRMLPREVWFNRWVIDFNYLEKDAEINKILESFREKVDKINDYMEKGGRALGHRVWQSIEAYLLNYPDVLAFYKWIDTDHGKDLIRKEKSSKDEIEKALNVAFEDQIVQKIMPKLRGIETRGVARHECLDKIKELLNSSLVDDFDNACNSGYGQFHWSTANYLSKQ